MKPGMQQKIETCGFSKSIKPPCETMFFFEENNTIDFIYATYTSKLVKNQFELVWDI